MLFGGPRLRARARARQDQTWSQQYEGCDARVMGGGGDLLSIEAPFARGAEVGRACPGAQIARSARAAAAGDLRRTLGGGDRTKPRRNVGLGVGL
jgi:hypothetical protein